MWDPAGLLSTRTVLPSSVRLLSHVGNFTTRSVEVILTAAGNTDLDATRSGCRCALQLCLPVENAAQSLL